MRSRWEALHSGLKLSIRSEKSARAFQTMKASHPGSLGSFADSAALVAMLNDRTCDAARLDEKDRILGALVRCAAGPCSSDLAIELLLLGLWPGLSAVFGRLARLFQERLDDLAAEIVGRFTECARRLDLTRCARVAATLVLNTERVVRSARTPELRRAAIGRRLSADFEAIADPMSERPTYLVDLQAWLRRTVPNDVELILGVVVGGRNCREVAEVFGISHACARQRLARALSRIRQEIERSAVTDRGATPAFVGR